MIPHFRPVRWPLLFGLILLSPLIFVACEDDESGNVQLTAQSNTENQSEIDLDAVDSIEGLVRLLLSPDRDQLRGHRFEVEAWINPPPAASGAPTTPPQGCPVVPEKQPWLSDSPIDTQIEVAGATIPNERLAQSIPVLRLVVPYTLGFVDIPERARLSGYVLEERHNDCPGAESLFVLEEVVDVLPAEDESDDEEVISDWDQAVSDFAGIVLEYPAGWELEERDTGQSARIRFLGPEPFRTIRLEVQDGETWWHPDASDSGPPNVLGGDRREPAIAGQAPARLVDDRRRTSTDERELRLVFNHNGRTSFLAMVIRDGADLDRESIQVFSEMAQRMRLQGDVAMSDPMDPILAASGDIGEGPFLSEADARYVALNASGMAAAEAVDAELVSEREARDAVDGACRDFDGQPAGVWLVTVNGTTPSGRDAYRLVYLDASNGNRLCQTEAPGVS